MHIGFEVLEPPPRRENPNKSLAERSQKGAKGEVRALKSLNPTPNILNREVLNPKES